MTLAAVMQLEELIEGAIEGESRREARQPRRIAMAGVDNVTAAPPRGVGP